MIDETYIEFSDILPEICSIPLVKEFDNLFVIRGTSKFFAAPGIRLGYGVSSNQTFLDRFKTNTNPLERKQPCGFYRPAYLYGF